MLSLEELRRAGRLLEARLRGHRLQAIAQPDATSVVFTTFGGSGEGRAGARQHLLFACAPGLARIGLIERPPPALKTPPAFSQYLRAHAENATIGGFRLIGEDRQLAMRARARAGDLDVLLAIFGRRSNVVLLDAAGRIVLALRPLDQTRPELAVGDAWVSPSSPAPRSGGDRFADVPDDRFFQAIDAAYTAAEDRDRHDSLAREIERALRREIKACERKLAKVGETLAAAKTASRLAREGELLKAELARVERGDTRVEARDFTTGEAVVIALDPKLSPSENLARIFKRYQKAVRSLAKAGPQQEDMRAALRAVEQLEAERKTLRDAAAFEAFSERPEIRRLLAKHAQKEGGGATRPGAAGPMKLGRHVVPQRLVPRRYRTASGLEVWVGRSDEGNDLLTTRLAAGNDLFFHLDGAPGSHVILRTEGRSDPPSEAVLDACELAVHYSKARNATRADVHVVPVKNVSKPKGAKRGLVMVRGGKTIHLRRMQTRLERILAARIDGAGDGAE